MRRLLKFKNYDVHAITTVHGDRINANIATWVMQSAMQGKFLTVALDLQDYTVTLVRAGGILNVNLLAEEQAALIPALGRKSGRTTNKLKRVPHVLDERGCPILTEAVGYVQCVVHGRVMSGDHELFVAAVLRQRVLHPDKKVLTNAFLVKKGWVRA